MSALQLILAVGTLAGMALVLLAERSKQRRGVWIVKPLASAGFICLALASGALNSGYGAAVLVGLVLCLGGDVLLIPRTPTTFRLGLGSFLLGHVAYIVAFALLGPGTRWLVALAPLALVAVVVFLWLRPNLGRMKLPVLAYVVVITLMVALAVGTMDAPGGGLRTLGAVAFYLSDLGVARDRFVREGFANRLFGLPLYYLGQVLLALSVGAL